jgi:hypothetical protein
VSDRAPNPDRLNRDCFCISLNDGALTAALRQEWGQSADAEAFLARSASVFSARPVFVAGQHLQRMAEVVQAVEAVVALPSYRNAVLAAAPSGASPAQTAGPHGLQVGAKGVLFGYDFHLADGRLSLIEINTNAGGAMLNAVLARAQRSCCDDMDGLVPSPQDADRFEQQLVAMFRQEWQLGRPGAGPLTRVAIVDEAPEAQALYPEFVLFQRLLRRNGIDALIADPSSLHVHAGRLWCADLPIDLVYNRLTDFYLEHAANAVLRQAWLQQAVVLTPHPQAHALYADKRLLACFSDEQRLKALGVPAGVQAVLLAHVPHTQVVTPERADALWAQRRQLFFKPVAGYGGRAAYRGDKLTRRVWASILEGDYVAQALVQPGERHVSAGVDDPPMKFDLRAYVYNAQVMWVAARVYQGQVTNFRTPGGGFAPVFSTPGSGLEERLQPPLCHT